MIVSKTGVHLAGKHLNKMQITSVEVALIFLGHENLVNLKSPSIWKCNAL